MALEKLDILEQTPKQLTSLFEVYMKPTMFSCNSKFKEKASNIPLVYAKVIRIHEDFYRILHSSLYGVSFLKKI